MQEVYFLARHTPFWSVPILVLGAEFAYMFWLKKKKRSAFIFLFIAVFGLVSTGLYSWAGGPEKSVDILKRIHRDHRK